MTALFDRLFDDAALFPPGDAPMAAAVPAHRQLRAHLGELTGPLVMPAARLDELTTHLSLGPPIGVSLIAATRELSAAAALVDAHPGLTLAAVEIPGATDAAAAQRAVRTLRHSVPDGVPVAVELPRTSALTAVLDVLADSGHRAKLRTGGLRAELFPSPQELATSLSACVQRGVAFKCTAGLHRAVRHTDGPTGFQHHGFLNVLVAVCALTDGAPTAVAAEHLLQTDADDLVTAVRAWTPERAGRVRATFTSFGTCSVTEPVDDLIALGLLPLPERIPA